MPFDAMKAATPAQRPGYNACLGVSGTQTGIVTLLQERAALVYVRLLTQELTHIHSQSGNRAVNAGLREKPGQAFSACRIRHKILVRIHTYYQFVAGLEKLLSLVRHKGAASSVHLHHLPGDFFLQAAMHAFAEVRNLLVLAVKIDIQILAAKLAAVVFHPFSEIEIVISDHRDHSYSLFHTSRFQQR